MSHAQKYLNHAEADPDENGKLSVHLRGLINNIESDYRNTEDRLENELGDLDDEYEYMDAFFYLYEWKQDDEYEDGFVPALSKFEEGYEDAKHRDWDVLASLFLEQLINLCDEVGGHHDELNRFLDETVSFLEGLYDGGGFSGHHTSLIDTLSEHVSRLDEDQVRRCADLWDDAAEYHEAKKDYDTERRYIELLIEYKRELDESVEDEQNRLIRNFEDEAELKGRRSHMLKATVYENALSRCIGFLDEDTERRWKRKIREENRKAVEEEFKTFGLDGDELEKLEEEVERNADSIYDFFKSRKAATNTSYALYSILKSDFYLPDFDKLDKEDTGISSILPRATISLEGDPVKRESADINGDSGDRYPRNYKFMLTYWEGVLVKTFRKLIDDGEVTAIDLINLFEISEGCDAHDAAFFTDTILRFFEDDYVSSMHIGTSRFDGILRRSFEHSGHAVTAMKEDGMRGRELGGIFGFIEEKISKDYGKYLKYRYTESSGLDMRNKTCHGRIRYFECDFTNSFLLIFNTLRCLVHIESSRYGSIYPEPIGPFS
jgi:hypothetical protein